MNMDRIMKKNWVPIGQAHSARKLEDALHVETGTEVQVDILDPVHCAICSGPRA